MVLSYLCKCNFVFIGGEPQSPLAAGDVKYNTTSTYVMRFGL